MGAFPSNPVWANQTLKPDRSHPKLLFVVTEDWYFVSHRLALAAAARKAGYEVAVATRVDRHADVIQEAGIRLLPIGFNRSGMRPHEELTTFASLIRLYRRERPDIVHHVALKPVVYGSLAARATRVPAVINALGGLGYVFSSATGHAKVVRRAIRPFLKLALAAPNAKLILQNRHDLETVAKAKLIKPGDAELIRGAGVDPGLYSVTNINAQPPLVILPARLLHEKGVGEFVDAARLLRKRGIDARFAIVGRPDPANPASFTIKDVERWAAEQLVEIWGWREDMPTVFSQAQIVCLPSYHEGLPKALLEAAASGCAIVASDIPGCREIVRHENTGLLVPPKDVDALAEALQRLIERPEQRSRLAACAKATVAAEFSLERVVSKTLELYEELMIRGSRR